jgi:hypothetical protein
MAGSGQVYLQDDVCFRGKKQRFADHTGIFAFDPKPKSDMAITTLVAPETVAFGCSTRIQPVSASLSEVLMKV